MYSTIFLVVLGLGVVRCSDYHNSSQTNYGSDYTYQGTQYCRPPIFRGLVVTPFKRLYKDGETIETYCREGYRMKEKQTNSTCMIFNIYEKYGDFIPALNSATCGGLWTCKPPIGHGIIVAPMKVFYDLGEKITVSCQEGYMQPRGGSTPTCKKRDYGRPHFGVSGSDTCRVLPTCTPPIGHGIIVAPMKVVYYVGEKITVSCQEGYMQPRGESTPTCKKRGNGQANFGVNASQTCRVLPTCKPPIAHGIIVAPMKVVYYLGENITVSCQEGYQQLRGESTPTCKKRLYGLANFGVSASQTCKEIRGCQAYSQEGLVMEPFELIYKPGTQVSFSCVDGYELAVSNVSVCQQSGYFDYERKGRGYPTTYACRKKVKCEPLSFRGLIITPEKSSYISGDEVVLSCEEGFELMAPNKSMCGYEEQRTGGYNTWGDDLLDWYQYRAEMIGVGDFRPIVRSGVCNPNPKCYEMSLRPRGIIATPNKTEYMLGETIEVSCMDGYELTDDSTRTCVRREEIDSFFRSGYYFKDTHADFQPDMDRVCKKKQTCRASRVRGVVLTPKKSVYKIGESVSVSCKPGYVLKRGNESTCQSRNGRRILYGKFVPKIDGDVCEKIVETTELPEEERSAEVKTSQPESQSSTESSSITEPTPPPTESTTSETTPRK